MWQEITVYLILLLTTIHLVLKSIEFFKPQKNSAACSSCASGSCGSCAMKVDFDSLKLNNKAKTLNTRSYSSNKSWSK